MPKSTLTWYKTKAKKIMKLLRAERQQDIADLLNVESRQVISYRMRKIYPEQIEDWLRMLDQIGMVVIDKEELEK